MNEREIVLGLFIGKENRGTFVQKRVTIGFCNGQKFEKPPKTCHIWAKRDTIYHFQKISCPEIVSRLAKRATIWQCRKDIKSNLEKNLGVKNRVTFLTMSKDTQF